ENLQLKGTFHYDEGFYYFRNLGNRILLGGARNLDFKTEETSVMETTDILQNHLEDFLKSVILPNQDFRIACRWSGIMAMGTEKSPVVQKISPRQIVAVRLSGMGVALAPKIGEMVAEMIG
ncbi:MAG: FAD-dependent oxidoreductase, partial [Kaistella sp.]